MTLALGLAATSFAVTREKQAVKAETMKTTTGIELKATAAEKAKKANANENWTTIGVGTYADGIFSSVYGASKDPIEVTIEQSGSMYRVVNPWPEIGSGYLIIDASDPEMVIVPEQITPMDDPYDGITYIASLSQIAIQGGLTKSQFLASYGARNIYMSDNVIYFPESSVVMNWPEADINGYYGTDPDVWYNCDESGYLVLPGGHITPEWESLGDCTFVDGIMATLMDSSLDPVTLPIEKNTRTEGLYRIPSAYTHALTNPGTTQPFVFNIFDPNNVTVASQPTGISFTGLGSCYIGGANLFNNQTVFATYNAETRVVTFPEKFIAYRFPNSTNPDWEPDYFYFMQNSEATYVTLPEDGGVGVKGVNFDANAPVEYFNLQGMPVANPEKGTIVIARQGNKVTKMVIK